MTKKLGEIITGVLILLFLLVSYFINISSETGSNYIVKDTLLGIIIFHNLFVLIIYILAGVFLIVKGSGLVRIDMEKRK